MIKTYRRHFVAIVVMLTTVMQVAALEAATTLHVGVGQTYSKIQAAIDASVNGDTVLVHDGTYEENIKFNGKAITVQSVNGRDVTIIDGDGSGSVVIFSEGSGKLDDFKITNGFSQYGGGILVNESSPTITNCFITGNKAIKDGGGIYVVNNSYPIITDCTISDNKAAQGSWNTGWGGGIFVDRSSLIITNCSITGNSAATAGGIAFRYSQQIIVLGCTIANNSSDYVGGGIGSLSSSPTITNCIIIDNSSKGGGGIVFNDVSPTITNCTITGNSATNSTMTSNSSGGGGGILCRISSSPIVVNSILWGNMAGGYPNEISLFENSSITITYSDIQGGWAGTGNIELNPLFVGSSDYRLTVNSPCIDKGTSSGAPTDDIEGTIRPQGSGYDMGAYEYTLGCPHDGDVNQDGGITPQDALMAFQHYLGIIQLSNCQQDRADVNQDGSITPADALCIFQKYLGLPSCLD